MKRITPSMRSATDPDTTYQVWQHHDKMYVVEETSRYYNGFFLRTEDKAHAIEVWNSLVKK